MSTVAGIPLREHDGFQVPTETLFLVVNSVLQLRVPDQAEQQMSPQFPTWYSRQIESFQRYQL